jgi:membrane-associated phospholipid phosphatase
MPTILYSIIFYVAPDAIHNLELFNGAARVGLMSIKVGLLLLIFLQTFVVPVISIYFIYRLGFIQSLQMQTLKDRRLPYLITVIIYTFVTAFYTKNITQFPEVALIMSSITFSLATVAFISLYWKISAHAVGISGAVGALLGIAIRLKDSQLLFPLLLLIIIAGFLISARLHLNAHTPSQVLAGVLLGLFISIMVTIFFL